MELNHIGLRTMHVSIRIWRLAWLLAMSGLRIRLLHINFLYPSYGSEIDLVKLSLTGVFD